MLGSRQRRDLFLKLLEQVRRNYKFVVVGYVVMPEHVHLLLSEPERANPSVVVQVLKQRFARQVIRARRKRQDRAQKILWETEGEEHVWQRRFYDFVVWSEYKRVEKLRYIHGNPVKRGLVLEPEQWGWSSCRFYTYGENGPVLVNEQKPAKLQLRGRAAAIANRTAC